jgi:hypothetical protein
MTHDPLGGPAPLNHTRQLAIDALCEHFANDAITVEDFERRVDVAHQATSVEELRALLRDLPTSNLPAAPGSAAQPAVREDYDYAVAPREHLKENGYAIAVMGGTRRRGRWSPARITHTITIMGGAELDFREALLPPGVTEVKVYAVMGGVEIIVPPNLTVESHGIGILGGFEHAGNEYRDYDPSAPVLRISGIAIMGGVDIKVRLVGESARDARKRRRQERRVERREELRGRVKEFREDFRRLGE